LVISKSCFGCFFKKEKISKNFVFVFLLLSLVYGFFLLLKVNCNLFAICPSFLEIILCSKFVSSSVLKLDIY